MSECEFYLGSYLEPKQDSEHALYKVSYQSSSEQLKLSSYRLPIKELTHFSLSDNVIYIANQIFSFQQRSDGAISSYRMDSHSALTLLNQESALGTGTVYTCLDQDKKWLFISNYVAGNIGVYPVREDGSIDKPVCMHRNIGSSVNKERQEGPHPHAIEVSPCNNYIAVADLGLDKVLFYQFANDKGVINLVDKLTFDCQPGSGPRHIRFHPNNHNILYIIHEMSAHIAVCQMTNDKVVEVASHKLPTKESEQATGAEIHTHPSGQYLYASVRGANLLVKYDIDPISYNLKLSNSVPCNGLTPLSFDVCNKGQYLLVANQDSNNASLFSIEQENGDLKLLASVEVEQPIMTCRC